MKNWTLWVCLLGLVVSCASKGYRINEQNLSLADIKQSIIAIIGEPRVLSENQRTYQSQYFSRKPDPKFDPLKSAERLHAKVVILGDRRPYDVQVEVLVEEKDAGAYVLVGTEMSEAKKIGQEIRQRLNQSRERRNVIDDFRAF